MNCLTIRTIFFLLIGLYSVVGQSNSSDVTESPDITDSTTVTTSQRTDTSRPTKTSSGITSTANFTSQSTQSVDGNDTSTDSKLEPSTEPPTQPSTSTTPTAKEPKLPNFDPPNYRYKVLKHYQEDYVTPSVFLLIGLIIIILTVAFHYYMDSKEKQRQIATGTRYKPDKKRKESSTKSNSPSEKVTENAPTQL